MQVRASRGVELLCRSLVEGDVDAQSVTAQGTVMGNIVVQDKVELGPAARVDGDITCQTLVVSSGAVFNGICSMAKRAAKAE